MASARVSSRKHAKKQPRSLHRERGSFLIIVCGNFLYHAATAPSQRGSVPAV